MPKRWKKRGKISKNKVQQPTEFSRKLENEAIPHEGRFSSQLASTRPSTEYIHCYCRNSSSRSICHCLSQLALGIQGGTDMVTRVLRTQPSCSAARERHSTILILRYLSKLEPTLLTVPLSQMKPTHPQPLPPPVAFSTTKKYVRYVEFAELSRPERVGSGSR